MFRLFRRFASPATPREAALEALARGRYAEAEALLTELLSREQAPPDRAFLHNKRGVARVGQRRADDARADFEAALALVVRYAPAIANLGNLLLEEGDLQGAIARYEEAIAADRDYAVAHFNVGVAYKRAGRLAEGVRALRMAQRLEGRMLGRPKRAP